MARMLRILLVSILLWGAVYTAAQTDLDDSYTWDENGVSINYPDDWDEYVDENGITHFASDDTDVFIIFDDFDADDPVEEYVEDAFIEYRFDNSARFDVDDVLVSELGDFADSASYFYTDTLDDDSFERAIFAIPLDDEFVAIAIAVPLTTSKIGEVDIVFDILASLTSGDGDTVDNADAYTFDNGYNINPGTDWNETDSGFSNGTSDVRFIFYEVDDPRTDTRAATLRETFADERIDAEDYDEDFLFFIELENDDEAMEYVYDEDGYTVLLVSFTPDDDTIIVAVVTPTDGTGDDVLDDFEAVYSFIGTLK